MASAAAGREDLSSSIYAAERRLAMWMMLPASLILLVFLLVPFIMAFGLSLTNQRLISPEPAQFVGIENYRRLLSVLAIPMQPTLDPATNQPQRDENGQLVYPRAREILRANEDTRFFQEMGQIDLFGTRYLIAAGDATFWRSLRNNVIFVLVVVPLQTSLALLLAILINQKIRGVNAFRTIYFSPVVTTMAIVSVLWFFMYNPDQGLINAVLGIFGIGPFQWLNSPESALPAIILLSIWQGVGFQMVIFLAGLQEIPEELYEAAGIDGANLFQQFFYVTLPSLRNTTIFVMISTTILAFKLFVQVDVMTFSTGGPEDSTMTMVLHLVNEGFRNQNVGFAAAISVVFVVLVLILALIQRRILTGTETR
jgi:multiple sugar transport system permease protein